MSRKRRGHAPIVLKCTTCGHGFGAPACASTEHKRIATDIELGERRADGSVVHRRRTSNRRTPAERATLRAGKLQVKREFRGEVTTILDSPRQPPLS